VSVSGKAIDPDFASIKVSIAPGTASIDATRNPDGTWSATFPLAGEGRYVISVTAADSLGHNAVASIPLTVDRTAPVIQISAVGSLFIGGAFNHALSLDVRAADA